MRVRERELSERIVKKRESCLNLDILSVDKHVNPYAYSIVLALCICDVIPKCGCRFYFTYTDYFFPLLKYSIDSSA